MIPTSPRWPVAVLGATGAVGQAFIRLLDAHPWFDLVDVAASERSAGKRYGDAARWLEGRMPASVGALTVKNCTPDEIAAPIVFSALDSGVAGEVERPPMVRLRALDLDGKPVEFEAEGLLCRALQHEVDHLDGILFIDRLDADERRRVAGELHAAAGRMVG